MLPRQSGIERFRAGFGHTGKNESDRQAQTDRACSQVDATKHYGWCRRCRKALPYARLVVQPDTRFCVSCLEFTESGR